MRHTSNLVFPYDPGYTGHWEAEKRREETREALTPGHDKDKALTSPNGQASRDLTADPSGW